MAQPAWGSFTPQKCPACKTWTYINNWQFSDNELPQDPNSPGNYINNLDHRFLMFGNQWVRDLELRVDSFDTESPNDFLSSAPLFQEPTITLTGTPSTGWKRFYRAPSGYSMQSWPGLMWFHTNPTISEPGFSIGRARVCCRAGGPRTATNQIYLLHRVRGVLVGSHDTVYMETAYSCDDAQEHQTFVLRGPSNKNFDIYARCGARPTETSWLAAGLSSGSQEWIHLPVQACSCPGTIYLAVNSTGGKGMFELVRSSHLPISHRSPILAGTDFNATPAQMTTFQNTLSEAARRFYGATEGTVQVELIFLFNSNDCDDCLGYQCDICFRQGCSPGGLCTGTAGCNGTMNIYNDYHNDPEGVMHEFGHMYFCAADEYSGGGAQWHCGHSIMASPWAQNNMCYDSDHLTDGTPGAPATPANSAWHQAKNAGVVNREADHTLENFAYDAFDFHNNVGYVYMMP